jgi:hypothetical protein
VWLDVEILSSKVYKTLYKRVVGSEVLAGVVNGAGRAGCYAGGVCVSMDDQ